jgi:putative ABC transport system substrate-binding protein
VFAIQRTGTTLPVVFGLSGDPIQAKLVDSLAHPGRNFTGLSFLSLELVGKRVELLKEMIPSVKRMAILANPLHPGEKGERQASESVIKALGLSFEYFELRPGTM